MVQIKEVRLTAQQIEVTWIMLDVEKAQKSFEIEIMKEKNTFCFYQNQRTPHTEKEKSLGT